MIYALIASVIANVLIALGLTFFHMREKRDLHDRLMAKSPDEYIYNTQVAPLEIDALEREFKGEPLAETPEFQKRAAIGRKF